MSIIHKYKKWIANQSMEKFDLPSSVIQFYFISICLFICFIGLGSFIENIPITDGNTTFLNSLLKIAPIFRLISWIGIWASLFIGFLLHLGFRRGHWKQ